MGYSLNNQNDRNIRSIVIYSMLYGTIQGEKVTGGGGAVIDYISETTQFKIKSRHSVCQSFVSYDSLFEYNKATVEISNFLSIGMTIWGVFNFFISFSFLLSR